MRNSASSFSAILCDSRLARAYATPNAIDAINAIGIVSLAISMPGSMGSADSSAGAPVAGSKLLAISVENGFGVTIMGLFSLMNTNQPKQAAKTNKSRNKQYFTTCVQYTARNRRTHCIVAGNHSDRSKSVR